MQRLAASAALIAVILAALWQWTPVASSGEVQRRLTADSQSCVPAALAGRHEESPAKPGTTGLPPRFEVALTNAKAEGLPLLVRLGNPRSLSATLRAQEILLQI
jgi:hypothetical protein